MILISRDDHRSVVMYFIYDMQQGTYVVSVQKRVGRKLTEIHYTNGIGGGGSRVGLDVFWRWGVTCLNYKLISNTAAVRFGTKMRNTRCLVRQGVSVRP